MAQARQAGLEGKVAFITAGGTGIGLGCARALVASGARVMLCARRAEVIEAAARELGPAAGAVICDVTRQESVDAAVAATVERLGGLDLAVHSAGIGGLSSVLSSTAEEFAQVLDTTLTGCFRCLRAVSHVMKTRGGGSIVNISSIAGALTHRWMTSYCVCKAGVNMLTRCAADDLGGYGIRVNAVMPSLVDTPLVAMLTGDAGARDEYLRRIQ